MSYNSWLRGSLILPSARDWLGLSRCLLTKGTSYNRTHISWPQLRALSTTLYFLALLLVYTVVLNEEMLINLPLLPHWLITLGSPPFPPSPYLEGILHRRAAHSGVTAWQSRGWFPCRRGAHWRSWLSDSGRTWGAHTLRQPKEREHVTFLAPSCLFPELPAHYSLLETPVNFWSPSIYRPIQGQHANFPLGSTLSLFLVHISWVGMTLSLVLEVGMWSRPD